VRAVVPDARLLVVGAYQRRHKRKYVRYAAEHDIHAVRFLGRASEEEKPRYYRSADVYCAPNAGFESFGIVLLEAMAAGVPVVASDIPGFRTVLDEGVQGVFASPRNEHSLALAIVHLLRDPERRARMGRAGKAKAALYDWSRIAQQVLEFYEQVLVSPRQTTFEEQT
jgi:phosphatidylinositol alpha-mannosyltransferase